MSATEHSIETTAVPETISGPFAGGSTIAMTPIDQDTVKLRITDVSEPHLFVDEADVGDALVRTVHRIDPLENERSRVTYRVEITGPAADQIGPRLGPQISSDFPQTLLALVERAASA